MILWLGSSISGTSCVFNFEFCKISVRFFFQRKCIRCTTVYVHIYHRHTSFENIKARYLPSKSAIFLWKSSSTFITFAIEYPWHCTVFVLACHSKEEMNRFWILTGKIAMVLRLFLPQFPWSFCIYWTIISPWTGGLLSNIAGPLSWTFHLAPCHAGTRWNDWSQHIHHLIYNFWWESLDNYTSVRRLIADLCVESAEKVNTTRIQLSHTVRSNVHDEEDLSIPDST